MKRPYQVVGVAFFLFSAFMVRQSLALDMYSPSGPGPGFFPFWVSVLLGLLSLVMVCQATFQQSEPKPEGFYASRIGYLRIGAIILAVIGTVLLMDPLGFRLTTLAFLLFLLYALGRQSVIVTTLVSLVGSFGVYYLFDELLRVPLPTGMFGF